MILGGLCADAGRKLSHDSHIMTQTGGSDSSIETLLVSETLHWNLICSTRPGSPLGAGDAGVMDAGEWVVPCG
jgi:hypothetical protein